MKTHTHTEAIDLADNSVGGNIPEKEQLFSEAAEQDSFPLRSNIGGWWTAALKSDPALKSAYQALGPKYEAQRTFRRQWAQQTFEDMRRVRIAIETRSEEDGEAGTYEAVEVIAMKEGGGAIGALAANNYAERCVEITRSGGTWKGRRLIEHNAFTKRWECLYLKKSVRSTMEKKWATEKRSVCSEAPEGATIEEVTTTPQKCSTSKLRVGDRKAANLEATDVATKPSQPASARKKTGGPRRRVGGAQKGEKGQCFGCQAPRH